jgi:tRNA(adenine34) deaminase
LDLIEKFLSSYYATKFSSPHEIPSFTQIYNLKGDLLAQNLNTVESKLNATLHSEINAIDSALTNIGQKYLVECKLITTLEPCLQCSGSIIRVKIPEVIYFLPAKKGEGISSYSLENIYLLNHFPKIVWIKNSSIEADFKAFFREKR